MKDYTNPQVPGCEWLRIRSSGLFCIRGPVTDYKPVKLDTRDLDEAVKLYHAKLGEPQVKGTNMKLADAWERFLTDAVTKKATRAKHRTTYDNHIKPLVGGKLGNFDRDFVRRVLDVAEKKTSARTGEKLSISMLRSIKAALSAFGTYAVTQEWLLVNPAHKLPARSWFTGSAKKGGNVVEHREVTMDEILNEDEITALVEACGDYADVNVFRVRMFVQLMPLIGTRIAECLALRVEDILDGEDRYGTWGSLYVGRQIGYGYVAGDTDTWFDPLLKLGGKPRFIPLTKRSRTLLDTYIERGRLEGWLQDGSLLFPTREGTPISTSFMSGKVRDAVKRVAGLEARGITSHNFRHTYASRLFANEVDEVTVARLIGNDPKVTREVYVHFIKQGSFANYIAERMGE